MSISFIICHGLEVCNMGEFILLPAEVLNAIRTKVNWHEYQTCSN
jgi:hypothetical protein